MLLRPFPGRVTAVSDPGSGSGLFVTCDLSKCPRQCAPGQENGTDHTEMKYFGSFIRLLPLIISDDPGENYRYSSTLLVLDIVQSQKE